MIKWCDRKDWGNTPRPVAINLFRQGIALEVIVQTTGCSIVSIEQLRQELNH